MWYSFGINSRLLKLSNNVRQKVLNEIIDTLAWLDREWFNYSVRTNRINPKNTDGWPSNTSGSDLQGLKLEHSKERYSGGIEPWEFTLPLYHRAMPQGA